MSKAYAVQLIAIQNATNVALFTRPCHAEEKLSQKYFKLREEQALLELRNHVATLKREKHALLELQKHVQKSKREIPSPAPTPPVIIDDKDEEDEEEDPMC
jgi:hypothetical protein